MLVNPDMPLFLAISSKAAITTGAVIGGAVAVIANKDRILEVTAQVLQKGANILNEKVEQRRRRVAAQSIPVDISDEEFEEEISSFARGDGYSELTTPSTTDLELSDDETENVAKRRNISPLIIDEVD